MKRVQAARIVPALIVAVLMLVTPVAGASHASELSHPLAPFVGVLTISPSCALSSAGAPVSQSGNTFALTGNLNGSLIDLCSGSTINGAGFALNYSAHAGGNPNVALTVNQSSGVTVEDLGIKNASIGIEAVGTSGLTVEDSAVPGASEYGVWVRNSSGTTVTTDRLNDTAGTAVYLLNVTDATVSYDNASGSYNGIQAYYSERIFAFHNDVSYGSSGGVGFYYTNDSNGTDNLAFESEYGIWAEHANNVSFYGNSDNDSTSYAGYFSDVTGLTLVANYLEDSGTYAADLEDVSQVRGDGNHLQDSDYGFYLDEVIGGTLNENNVSFTSYGIYDTYGNDLSFSHNQVFEASVAFGAEYARSTQISDNYAPFAYDGVSEYEDQGTSVVGNDFTNSSSAGVYSEGGTSGLWLSDNDLANASGDGVYLDEPVGNITIAGNDLNAPSGYGVYLYESYGALTFTDNRLTNASNYGLYLEDMYGPVSITDNDLSGAGVYAVYLQSGYGATTITGNDASNAHYAAFYVYESYGVADLSDNTAENSTDYGLYLYDAEGPVDVAGNDFSHSMGFGIYAYYPYGPLNVTGNDLAESDIGVAIQESEGPLSIVDNNVTYSIDEGINVEYAYDYGGVTIQDNNASHSAGTALLYYEEEWGSEPITHNDFSNSRAVEINASYYLAITGNDFLNDAWINITHSELFEFDHNDIATSGFNATGSSMTLSTGWNAPYPIGGNYWTGYTGHDQYSGPGQNVPGADGIGDTPEPIPSAGVGIVDQYPLMHPWTSAPAALEFTETGLPGSLPWNVTVAFGGSGTGSIEGTGQGSAPAVLELAYAAATPYSYTIPEVSGYTAAPASGSGVTPTDGTGQTAVVFTGVYQAAFEAFGISLGTTWSVSLNGVTYPSTTDWDNVSVGNGGWSWTAAATGSPSVSGMVTVSGASVVVSVTFPAPHYGIEFVESGLAVGAMWTVVLGGVTLSSSGATIGFSEPNGSFAYTITTNSASATVTPASGTATVNGAGWGIAVSIVGPAASLPPGTYSVVFVEAGLSSGATWTVSFDDTMQTSSGTTIVFQVHNGSYSYAVTTTGSASVHSGGNGILTVAGTAVTQTVLFGSATGVGVVGSTGPNWVDVYVLLAVAALLGILAAIGWARRGRQGGSPGSSSAAPSAWSSAPTAAPPPGATGPATPPPGAEGTPPPPAG